SESGILGAILEIFKLRGSRRRRRHGAEGTQRYTKRIYFKMVRAWNQAWKIFQAAVYLVHLAVSRTLAGQGEKWLAWSGLTRARSKKPHSIGRPNSEYVAGFFVLSGCRSATVSLPRCDCFVA